MKKFVNWINKVWTHNQDTAKPRDFGIRAFIHIPIGILCSIPVWGWALTYLFYKYERNEDAHRKDQAWKDLYGGIAGYITGIVIQFILLMVYRPWE